MFAKRLASLVDRKNGGGSNRATARLVCFGLGCIAASLPTAIAQPLGESRQVALVLTQDFDSPQGVLWRLQRTDKNAPWVQVGAPFAVWLGQKGIGWSLDVQNPPVAGPVKREGDGRSPAGVFALETLWGYGQAAPPGVRWPYRTISSDHRCVDDPESQHYNELLAWPARKGSPPWRSAESLLLPTDHYKYLLVVSHNRASVKKGAGSCIFVHVAPPPGQTTAGCTALAQTDLLELLRWLDPAKKPRLVLWPKAALGHRYRARLGFPAGLAD